MIRHFFVWLHRWAGLAMAFFLVVVGLTGSILAFDHDLRRLLTPQLYATPRPGVAPLGLGALVDRAEALVPHGQVVDIDVGVGLDQIDVRFNPRKDPATGQPYELGFGDLYLNPWSGEELGRLMPGDDPWYVMSFILRLHDALALGEPGGWVLGIVALLWTLDCFVGFYLTLPVAIAAFWRRWGPAWLIKWKAGAFRFNFDLHRASGLWLWPALFIFAWSSVMFNFSPVYDWVTGAVFDYHPSRMVEVISMPPHHNETPRLDFRAAISTGERLMAEQAASHGFSVERVEVLSFDAESGGYYYRVKSSRDITDGFGATSLSFDGDTGALRSLSLPTGEHSGNTITHWLGALHFADVYGLLPYRIFVCVLGLVIAMLSVTGVYIWWKKRRARKFSKAHRGVAAAAEMVAE